MIFSPDLCELILSGRKTVTRRPVKYVPDIRSKNRDAIPCRYLPGIDYAVQPGRGKKSIGRVRIVSVRRENLMDVWKPYECTWEGFKTPAAFWSRWATIYGDGFDHYQQVWRIEFELVPNQGEK
jgi:hypothetical protein